ncbi:hypothetical protein CHCC20335_1038 [Bacillus paralicheniformis]|nr:hypothetical protein CHCC20335_1038 [Bacillus paralicheniformis]
MSQNRCFKSGAKTALPDKKGSRSVSYRTVSFQAFDNSAAI